MLCKVEVPVLIPLYFYFNNICVFTYAIQLHCTFCIMGKLVYINSKLNLLNVGGAKSSDNIAIVIFIWPETKWSNLDQVDE